MNMYQHEDDPKEEIRTESCKTCRFYQPIGTRVDTNFGECRRHAPSLSPSITLPGSQWPKVAEYAWCGEYKPISKS